MSVPQAIQGATFNTFAHYASDGGLGGLDPSPNWVPDAEGALEAVASCGKHYHRFAKADVLAGNLPCPHGCASPAFKST